MRKIEEEDLKYILVILMGSLYHITSTLHHELCFLANQMI